MIHFIFIFFKQIRPFKSAHVNRGTDRELLKLTKYLKAIAPLDDFTHLKHSHWERWYLLFYSFYLYCIGY